MRALVWVEGEASDVDEGVYFELGGSEAEVEHDLRAIRTCYATTEIDIDRIDALRDLRSARRTSAIVLRARVLGRDCETLVRHLRESGFSIAADIGLGVVHARGSLDSVEELIAQREIAVGLGGLMYFEHLPEEWRARVDVFGALPETSDLAAEIKHRFDPEDLLNPGRFGMGKDFSDER